MKNLQSFKKKHSIVPVGIAAIFVLAVGAYLAVAAVSGTWPFIRDERNTANGNSVAENTQSSIDQHKSDLSDRENNTGSNTGAADGSQSSDSTSAKKKATVIITDAAQYDQTVEVRSYIPDAYEDGKCTITFTKSDTTVTRQTPAYRDATTTICTNPLITRASFSQTGVWNVSVTFESASYKGVSSSQNVTIN